MQVLGGIRRVWQEKHFHTSSKLYILDSNLEIIAPITAIFADGHEALLQNTIAPTG